jgi:hypothetical protein
MQGEELKVWAGVLLITGAFLMVSSLGVLLAPSFKAIEEIQAPSFVVRVHEWLGIAPARRVWRFTKLKRAAPIYLASGGGLTVIGAAGLCWTSREIGKPARNTPRSRGDPLRERVSRVRYNRIPSPGLEPPEPIERDPRLKKRETAVWEGILAEFDVLVSCLGHTEPEEWARARILTLVESLRKESRPRLKKALYALNQAEGVVRELKKEGIHGEIRDLGSSERDYRQ